MSNNIPIIKQNKVNNFYFEKKINFNAVDIFFRYNEYLNLYNLFLILKTYLYYPENLIRFIMIIGANDSEGEKVTNIFHHLRQSKLKKMQYLDFEEWYETIYSADYEYLKSFKYYGIRIVFFNNSIAWREGKIFPIYPWEEKIIHSSTKNIDILEYNKSKEKTNKFKKLYHNIRKKYMILLLKQSKKKFKK